MNVLYIIRGLPGSGKSTLAKKLVDRDRHVEADMYHMKNGVYCYDPSKAKAAHHWCSVSVARMLFISSEDCAVSNTFTTFSEYGLYLNIAKSNGYTPLVIECHSAWESIHGVPEEVIQKMKDRWEPTPIGDCHEK